VSALPIATIGHGETEQSTLDLATFLGFRKQPHSCREGMCHSPTRPHNIQIRHFACWVLPGLLHTSTASDKCYRV